MRRLPLIISGFVLVYGLTALALSAVISEPYAEWYQIIFMPVICVVFTAGHYFRKWGLPTEGDWMFVTPTHFGVVILMTLIAAFVYGLTWALMKMFHRKK